MSLRFVLALVLGVSVMGIAQGSPRMNEVELFRSGQGGYHTYRIPALVAAGKNTVLAFCEGRRNSAADSGDIDILLRRSLDGGLTWGKVQLVVPGGGNTSGNPCPIVDSSDGTVWLLFCKNLARGAESLITEGRAPRTVWITKSTDLGVTWAEPKEITNSVKEKSWTWYATGPGHGIQLKSGRLVAACDHGRKSGAKRYGHSHVIYSDDHGKTWKIGGIVDNGTNESTVVELSDGRLYINCRNTRQGVEVPAARIHAWSKDGGLSFSKTARDGVLIEPICQASLIRVPGDRDVVLFSNPASGKREKMTLRLSRDACATWPISRVLYAGPSAYSDLAVADDGSICCMYERGRANPYESITFARFDLEWLTGGPKSR